METLQVDDLLMRIRSGDREAAGEFITRFGPRVRARIRHSLSPTMRRVFDSQDVLSTVARRFDVYVRAGKVEAVSEEQLWGLVLTIARNCIAEKGRIIARLKSVEGEDSEFARAMLHRLDDSQAGAAPDAEGIIEHAFHQLPDATDRQILGMWLIGLPHAEIASTLGLVAGTVRWRWSQIRDTLRLSLA